MISLAGVPPAGGFWAKILIFQAGRRGGSLGPLARRDDVVDLRRQHHYYFLVPRQMIFRIRRRVPVTGADARDRGGGPGHGRPHRDVRAAEPVRAARRPVDVGRCGVVRLRRTRGPRIEPPRESICSRRDERDTWHQSSQDVGADRRPDGAVPARRRADRGRAGRRSRSCSGSCSTSRCTGGRDRSPCARRGRAR